MTELSCAIGESCAIVEPEPLSCANAEATSPYLPGTQVQWALDSTSLGALKTCPRYYLSLIHI